VGWRGAAVVILAFVEGTAVRVLRLCEMLLGDLTPALANVVVGAVVMSKRGWRRLSDRTLLELEMSL